MIFKLGLAILGACLSLGCYSTKPKFVDDPAVETARKPKNTVQCEPVAQWVRPTPPTAPPEVVTASSSLLASSRR